MISRFTTDGQFTRLGAAYFRARDEGKSLRRFSPWWRIRSVERRLALLEGDYRRRLHDLSRAK